MKIEFQRSGGFANLKLTTIVDIDKLSSNEATKLRSLVASLDRPIQHEAASNSRDAFSYTIKVIDGSAAKTYKIDQASSNELIDYLIEKARQTT